MDITLVDIIKMSKNKTVKPKKQRISGALAQRQSNFQRNQFPLAAQAARKVAAILIRSKLFNGVRTINMNKLRVSASVVQERAVNNEGGFNVKGSAPYGVQQFKQHSNVPPKCYKLSMHCLQT